MSQLSTKLEWPLANTKWAATLNPIIALPILNGNKIDNINLTATTPKTINHLLQRMQQGWILIDNTASANVWRTRAFNESTITLEASANTTVSLWVF